MPSPSTPILPSFRKRRPMNPQFIMLKLFMDALPLPPLTHGSEPPIHLHATFFLTKHFAVDLGYQFWWNQWGPYSPTLNKDVHQLRTDMVHQALPNPPDILSPDMMIRLEHLSPLWAAPHDLSIAHAEWIQFLAKFWYLSQLSHDPLLKPHILLRFQHPERLPWIPYAENTLQAIIRRTRHHKPISCVPYAPNPSFHQSPICHGPRAPRLIQDRQTIQGHCRHIIDTPPPTILRS